MKTIPLSRPRESNRFRALFGGGLRRVWLSEGGPGMRVACTIAAVSENHRELRHDGFLPGSCRNSSVWSLRACCRSAGNRPMRREYPKVGPQVRRECDHDKRDATPRQAGSRPRVVACATAKPGFPSGWAVPVTTGATAVGRRLRSAAGREGRGGRGCGNVRRGASRPRSCWPVARPVRYRK